jgi:hypothetical protein
MRKDPYKPSVSQVLTAMGPFEVFTMAFMLLMLFTVLVGGGQALINYIVPGTFKTITVPQEKPPSTTEILLKKGAVKAVDHFLK